MNNDRNLRLTPMQIVLLHALLRRAEDEAAKGDNFERLNETGTCARNQFIALQIEVEKLHNNTMKGTL